MTFQELLKEDYSYRCYEFFKSGLAVQNKRPIQVTRIDNADKTTLFIFLLENQRGLINTKRVRMSTPDAVFFSSYTSNDFPELELQYINRRSKNNADTGGD